MNRSHTELVQTLVSDNISQATEKNSIRDARTTQPGEIFFNTMGYRSSETIQS